MKKDTKNKLREIKKYLNLDKDEEVIERLINNYDLSSWKNYNKNENTTKNR